MSGRAMKRIRRAARAACDASIKTMMVRSYKVPATLAKDLNSEAIMQDGKPIVLIPEHKRYTAFWPRNSYRRILRELKTNRPAGHPVPRPEAE
jgi:hypothetical protein